MARQIRRMKLKLVMVGDRAVGKTSLIQRYVFNTFREAYEGTLGAKLHLLQFVKQVAAEQVVEAEVGLFDLMGEHSARDHFRDALFWGTHGYFAVCDASRPETFDYLVDWVGVVRAIAGDVPYRILFNKADLLPEPVLEPSVVEWLRVVFPGVPYSLVSAKTGNEVDRAMTLLLEEVVDRLLARSRARRTGRIVGNKILAFALRRGRTGVTKNELLAAFKDLDYTGLMREVEDLEKAGLLTREEMGPANFRVLLTEEGERAATREGREDYIVDEVT
ncbi:MAG TPA: hypothetical protein VI915_00055 [Thermoplasmata archaeon]|nr:hypothetical protein [Thermoplasmata archaeon]